MREAFVPLNREVIMLAAGEGRAQVRLLRNPVKDSG